MRHWRAWRCRSDGAPRAGQAGSRSAGYASENAVAIAGTWGAAGTHRVEREHSNDLVPRQVDIRLPAHDLGQGLCDQVGASVGLSHGVCLARETAGERIAALGDGMAAMDLAPHELADSDRVGGSCAGLGQ